MRTARSLPYGAVSVREGLPNRDPLDSDPTLQRPPGQRSPRQNPPGQTPPDSDPPQTTLTEIP